MNKPDYPRPELAWVAPVRIVGPAPGLRTPPAPTPKEGLQRGESWWADCPRCKCSGRIDLGRLVENGRGDVGADAMRCTNCKHPDISVRITSPLRTGCAG